jgi:hypothetical protein
MKTGSCAVALSWALLLFGSVAAAQQTTPPAPDNDNPAVITEPQSDVSKSVPQVRIVRLSQITGDVEVDRGTGEGFEAPLLNLPITEGTKLQTAQGFAEVEFEDDSTLRLTPNTSVAFTQLGRAASGATLSTISVSRGMVFVSLARTSGNEFALAFDGQKVSLAPSSHIRLDVSKVASSLAILSGSVRVDTPAEAETVDKKKTLSFPGANAGQFTVGKNVESPLDFWDKGAIDYHRRYAKYAASGSRGNQFGLSDLNYYGSFRNMRGCGPMWRPYFANATWDPFSNGSWVWYPTPGWTWVSPYPWGWAPYHSGNWAYCPNVGWGWWPNHHWVGLRNHPKPPEPRYGLRPIHLPRPPQPGDPTTIRLNEHTAVVSNETGGQFVLRQNSAGLGVPRNILSDLSYASHLVEKDNLSGVSVNSYGISSVVGKSRAEPGTAVGRSEGASRISSPRVSGAAATGSASRPSYAGGSSSSSSSSYVSSSERSAGGSTGGSAGARR